MIASPQQRLHRWARRTQVPGESYAAQLSSSVNLKVHLCRSVDSHLEEACCLGAQTGLEVASPAWVDRLQTGWGMFRDGTLDGYQTDSPACCLPRLDQRDEETPTNAPHLSSKLVQVQHAAAGCRQTHALNALERGRAT